MELPYKFAWNAVVISGLVLPVVVWIYMLDKVQKQMCRSAGPSITASFEPLGHRRNVASLSLLIGITLVDIHLNWLNWFNFLILVAGALVTLTDCMIFLSLFLDVRRVPVSTVSFLIQLDP